MSDLVTAMHILTHHVWPICSKVSTFLFNLKILFYLFKRNVNSHLCQRVKDVQSMIKWTPSWPSLPNWPSDCKDTFGKPPQRTYLIFVIFCTPAHIEAWKKYAKKCVNSRQNPSCNKTAEFHFGEYLLFEWLYLVLGWYVWYFKSTNIAQSQETSLNTVPLAFLAENCTPAWKKYTSTAGGAGDKYQLCLSPV